MKPFTLSLLLLSVPAFARDPAPPTEQALDKDLSAIRTQLDQLDRQLQRSIERLNALAGEPAVAVDDSLYEAASNGKPWLDVELTNVDHDLGAYFGVTHGVLVLRAGGKLGLETGDVLLRVGDRAVEAPGQAIRLLGRYAPGDRIPLEVRRKGAVKDLTANVPRS